MKLENSNMSTALISCILDADEVEVDLTDYVVENEVVEVLTEITRNVVDETNSVLNYLTLSNENNITRSRLD